MTDKTSYEIPSNWDFFDFEESSLLCNLSEEDFEIIKQKAIASFLEKGNFTPKSKAKMLKLQQNINEKEFPLFYGNWFDLHEKSPSLYELKRRESVTYQILVSSKNWQEKFWIIQKYVDEFRDDNKNDPVYAAAIVFKLMNEGGVRMLNWCISEFGNILNRGRVIDGKCEKIKLPHEPQKLITCKIEKQTKKQIL